MSRLARLAIPTIAAALAIAVTAPVIADHASARPVRPDWDRGDRGDVARLRAENEQLRRDLGLYHQAYDELDAGLDRVERANRRNRDRRSMYAIDRALHDARDRASQYLQPESVDDDQLPPPPPPPPMPTQPYAMNDRDFASLSVQVARAPFADAKLDMIRTAAQTNYFTVAQVVQLMKLASFDDTRVEIAIACAPHIVDRDRMFELYGALSFSSSRDTLRDRIGAN